MPKLCVCHIWNSYPINITLKKGISSFSHWKQTRWCKLTWWQINWSGRSHSGTYKQKHFHIWSMPYNILAPCVDWLKGESQRIKEAHPRASSSVKFWSAYPLHFCKVEPPPICLPSTSVTHQHGCPSTLNMDSKWHCPVTEYRKHLQCPI